MDDNRNELGCLQLCLGCYKIVIALYKITTAVDVGHGVLDQTTVFEKNNSKISLETKIKTDLVREMSLSWTAAIGIIKFSNADVHDSDNDTLKMGKCHCP